jgi:EAL domain-containing protein (putative c-di-GMP-specific phosphodiesterase class I)
LLAEFPDASPHRLRLEITETTALSELTSVEQIITDCQALGVSFSLDDFGTGYSSLVYLRRLSATELKIDQRFVRDMLNNREDQAIIEGIIALGRAFKRTVVAEGVESPEQIQRLRELGCEVMQGYFFARPMPSDQIMDWMRSFDMSSM